jgi:hypothetical protein
LLFLWLKYLLFLDPPRKLLYLLLFDAYWLLLKLPQLGFSSVAARQLELLLSHLPEDSSLFPPPHVALLDQWLGSHPNQQALQLAFCRVSSWLVHSTVAIFLVIDPPLNRDRTIVIIRVNFSAVVVDLINIHIRVRQSSLCVCVCVSVCVCVCVMVWSS